MWHRFYIGLAVVIPGLLDLALLTAAGAHRLQLGSSGYTRSPLIGVELLLTGLVGGYLPILAGFSTIAGALALDTPTMLYMV